MNDKNMVKQDQNKGIKKLLRIVTHSIHISDIIPFVAFFAIFMYFNIVSEGKMMTPFNLNSLFAQSMTTILIGSGVMFVVAQGSIDLSVGVNLALSGVIGTHLALVTGSAVLFIPIILIVATCVGLLNGVIVSKCKVDSFMVTLAMLIGVRGIVNYIQTRVGDERIPEAMMFFKDENVRLITFIVIFVIIIYVFEFTRLGKYSKAIGENEVAARFVGIPVGTVKILAFGIAGLMAGFGSIFTVTVENTSQTMGVFVEIQVAMAIFFGGVLVTGGISAKMYKLVLGALSIETIERGLFLIGKSNTEVTESVQGILLLTILFVTILASNRVKLRRRKIGTDAEIEEVVAE